MATQEQALAIAQRCIEGQATVYEFAQALEELRRVQLVEAMFGPCADRQAARQFLKQALHAASDEDAALRRRRGETI